MSNAVGQKYYDVRIKKTASGGTWLCASLHSLPAILTPNPQCSRGDVPLTEQGEHRLTESPDPNPMSDTTHACNSPYV